jgi:hypothetical protein
MTKSPYLAMDAYISDDGLYRYWLSRRLSIGERSVLFVGLNPSWADAAEDDKTLGRCASFARLWGFDWLYMGNLNGRISPDPKKLPVDPLTAVGDMNQEILQWLVRRSEVMVAAWGQNRLNDHAKILARWILSFAIDDNTLAVNVASRAKNRRVVDKDAAHAHAQANCWSAADAKTILQTAERIASPQMTAFLYLAFDAGARKNANWRRCSGVTSTSRPGRWQLRSNWTRVGRCRCSVRRRRNAGGWPSSVPRRSRS